MLSPTITPRYLKGVDIEEQPTTEATASTVSLGISTSNAKLPVIQDLHLEPNPKEQRTSSKKSHLTES
ncbi:hypothetical protein Tco_0420014, partial [Tanacetum coccineum]